MSWNTQTTFDLVALDKKANNIAIICKGYYLEVI